MKKIERFNSITFRERRLCWCLINYTRLDVSSCFLFSLSLSYAICHGSINATPTRVWDHLNYSDSLPNYSSACLSTNFVPFISLFESLDFHRNTNKQLCQKMTNVRIIVEWKHHFPLKLSCVAPVPRYYQKCQCTLDFDTRPTTNESDRKSKRLFDVRSFAYTCNTWNVQAEIASRLFTQLVRLFFRKDYYQSTCCTRSPRLVGLVFRNYR